MANATQTKPKPPFRRKSPSLKMTPKRQLALRLPRVKKNHAWKHSAPSCKKPLQNANLPFQPPSLHSAKNAQQTVLKTKLPLPLPACQIPLLLRSLQKAKTLKHAAPRRKLLLKMRRNLTRTINHPLKFPAQKRKFLLNRPPLPPKSLNSADS